jgi:hypothetical protein
MPPVKKYYREMNSKLNEIASLGRALPSFFREPVTVQMAEDQIKRDMDRREENFLELVRAQIYERSSGLYLKLFQIAGCDFGDLRTQVRRHGLDATLKQLAEEGVYITSDEYKGKKEIVRAGGSFKVSPDDFVSSDLSPGFVSQSSGTSNRPTTSRTSLDSLAATTFAVCILHSAHNLFSHSYAVYDTVLPAGGALFNLLIYAKMGIATDRWFARKNPIHSRLAHGYHFLTTCLIVLMGKRFGPGFPWPEILDDTDVHPIIRWILERGREGRACCIRTSASNAAKIAREALETGTTLEGTKFVVSGEPYTESKWEIINRAGAGAIPRYSFSGGGNVGLGCANPLHIDEMHVNEHMLALISHPKPLSPDGPPIYPLLYTTLHPFAHRFFINVENGDYATLERRRCGCALEKAGLTLHLSRIRSFEKFTSEGMNYFYGDLFDLMEKILPSEFGGGPGDYQLVEEEDSNGRTRLTLVVHPEIGGIDQTKLLSRLHESLSQGSRGNQFQTKIWQAAGTIRLRREIPHANPRGKILPLHIPH